MSTYHMLNDRPIDQWMVTELKDELQRRNLPVSGLKDDLVKRLFEAIQDETLDGGEKPRGGTPSPEELKRGETLGPVDASVNQASSEQHVDECVSEVTKQGADFVSSVTEAYDESILATSEVTQEGVVSTAEASQRSLDAVAEVDSSLVDTAATDETNGISLGSASSGNSRVKEANPYSEGHGDTFEKKPEDDTNKEMVVDDVASHVTGGDIKLGISVHRKILEVEDETAPPDDIILHGDNEDADAAAAAESEDDTSKNMVIDDVFLCITHINVKLGDKVDCKSEHEEVPILPDAIAWQDDPKDAGVVAAAKSMIPEENLSGKGLELASSGNTIVKEANPHSETHGDTSEENPEDDTNKKMAVDDVPFDVTSGDIKLGVNVHSKILEVEYLTAPPDDIMLHGDNEDAAAVAAAESEDDTSKNMVIDDVLPNITHTNVKLGVKVDCKTEQEEVPRVFDAIASQDDPKESIIPKDNFSENTLIYGNGHEDLNCTNGDSKPILCGTKDQVSEVNPDLDSQIQCVSILHDNISTDEKNDVKGKLNAGNCDLELEAKQEMVKPSSTIPFRGDHLQVLDANKELHKNETSLQELGSTSNIDLDREKESPDGCSHEKLNLDRSSGDESMDEDVTERKRADSNIKSDDLGGKSEVTSAQVLKEVSLLDTDAEGSSAHTKEVVAEEKPPIPAEKRKPEDI